MDLPKFFRTYQHKRFNYIPVYYDRQKEELKERVRRVEQEESNKNGGEFQKSIIKGSFRHVSAYRAKANRSSALRTVLIIIILMAFVLFLFTI